MRSLPPRTTSPHMSRLAAMVTLHLSSLTLIPKVIFHNLSIHRFSYTHHTMHITSYASQVGAFLCEGPPPGPLRRRVPPITVGPHPGSQYLAPALALGSPVLAPQGHPTSGYLVKSPLTISFASVRVRSCELRRYNHPRHTLTTN